MWQVTPKANNPKGKGSEPPKAKPFLFDNSANENAIDWILDQLPERTRFVPRLYALPLFASWTSRPPIVLWRFARATSPRSRFLPLYGPPLMPFMLPRQRPMTL